ncbi:MAG: glycoside hydrolase family 127 protein [Eubacteriales bacterium]|nr:glycoside hydrolase family 127 protein [Eubacteriales bacterium]
MKKQNQISEKSYKASGFIGRYQKLVTETVIPWQEKILWDEAPDTEKSHAIANFINAGKALRGEDTGDGFYGMVFQDSDVAKWIESASYSLMNNPDPELEAELDKVIGYIAGAQDKDGYLNTYFTIKDQDKRWTNLHEAHELYVAGHMIEAACAHFEATGKRALLDVMQKNMECIYDHFVTKNNPGVPGHPEIELALMKLYRITGDKKALELCAHFLNKRGQDPELFIREADNRTWSVWGSNPRDEGDLEYRQCDKPLRELTQATGHAVRAVYLYAGMADFASETEDKELQGACGRLWKNIVERKMYVTGGIGSTVLGEAFTVDYDLPPDTAYAETCASVGLMFFASRMLENELKGEYADVMERAFYNTVLAGMQLDGKRFFYVNPLEVNPGISGVAVTHKHDLPVRPKWYQCACCPPNVARLIESFGKYAYGENESTSFCHMIASGKVVFNNGMTLECETDYPHGMNVKYTVKGNGKLAVHIPGWSKDFSVAVNGGQVHPGLDNGYIYFDINGSSDIEIKLDDEPHFVYASSRIPRAAGMVSLRRGPLVYCFEGTDNGSVKTLRIDRNYAPVVSSYSAELQADTLSVKAVRENDSEELYSDVPPAVTPCEATAVPYYTWGNRGETEMRVWMN